MGQMKRIWGEMTEREQQALETLNAVAKGRLRPTNATCEWLQQVAAKKARELEQGIFLRDVKEEEAHDGTEVRLV